MSFLGVGVATIDSLPVAQWNDCKLILKRLIKHNTEAHESAAKAGKELGVLLEYFPISAWLQVADVTTRPLIYVQVPEVKEIINQAQAVIDKKKPKEGESPIREIVEEQNLPNMLLLKHVWGYNKEDIGKKTVSAIIYKYLKERMFSKEHVTTTFLATRFATTSSTLHKHIVGMKYKGGAQPEKYRYGESEEWTRKQTTEDTETDKNKGKGVGKKSGKKRDAAEIPEETSKPRKRRKQDGDDDDGGEGTSRPRRKRGRDEDDDDEDDNNRDKPLKPPVTSKGLVIRN